MPKKERQVYNKQVTKERETRLQRMTDRLANETAVRDSEIRRHWMSTYQERLAAQTAQARLQGMMALVTCVCSLNMHAHTHVETEVWAVAPSLQVEDKAECGHKAQPKGVCSGSFFWAFISCQPVYICLSRQKFIGCGRYEFPMNDNS